MPRPLRLDYRGAMHHVFMRGVARSAVAVDDHDFEHALYLLERAVARYELVCHAWCFLPNHSHLLVTSQLEKSRTAMQWLGMCTAQSFNRRHERPVTCIRDGSDRDSSRTTATSSSSRGICHSTRFEQDSVHRRPTGLVELRGDRRPEGAPWFLEAGLLWSSRFGRRVRRVGRDGVIEVDCSTRTDSASDPRRGRLSRACCETDCDEASRPPTSARIQKSAIANTSASALPRSGAIA